MTAECGQCKTKQTVHVAVRSGLGMTGSQMIRGINCEKFFDVILPDKIVWSESGFSGVCNGVSGGRVKLS